MKKLMTLLFLGISILLYAQTQISEGEVTGTWQKSGSPYLINGNISIPRNGTLSIEPGVEVQFNGKYKFQIYGRLRAIGTMSDSIRFTAIDISAGWNGMRFINQDDYAIQPSEIAFSVFSYGKAENNDYDNNEPYWSEFANGGAIAILNTSKVEIRNSYFHDNTAREGGAIFIRDCAPLVLNSVFKKNIAHATGDSYSGGGAIMIANSDAKIIQCVFNGNSTAKNGGAIVVNDNSKEFDSSRAELKYLSILNNSADEGYAVYICTKGPLQFSHSEIIGNDGGGVHVCVLNDLGLQALYFYNLKISYNKGLPLNVEGNLFTLSNSIIDHNEGYTAVYVNGNFFLLNSIITKNTYNLSAITGPNSFNGGFRATVMNSIIWDNNLGLDDYGDGGNEGKFGVFYSDIQGKRDDYIEWGSGVVNKDPKFRNSAEDNYHLATDSPLLDEGNPDEIYNDELLDPDAGLGTIKNDIGAYGGRHGYWAEKPVANFTAEVTKGNVPLEVQFYDKSLYGVKSFQWDFNNDGIFESMEQNPKFTYTEEGMFSVKLVVSTGEYQDTLVMDNYISTNGTHFSGEVYGDWNTIDTAYIDGDIYIPKDKSLTINPGTHVYFTGEYTFDIFGQLLANGNEMDSICFFADSLGRDYSNPYRNFKGHWYGLGFKNTDINGSLKSEVSYCDFKHAVSKGWEILWESWMDQDRDSLGAPIRLYYSSNVNLHNLTISECNSDVFANIQMVHSSPEISQITFKDTWSAMHFRNFSNAKVHDLDLESARIYIINSNPEFDNITVHDTYETGLIGDDFGGKITNSVFRNNTYSYTGSGGAIKLLNGSSPKFEHVFFEGNKSNYTGGWYGMGGVGYLLDSSPEFVNCEFTGNSSYGDGSVFYIGSNDYSHPWITTMKNCLIVKNESAAGSGTIVTSTNTRLEMINSTLADNSATLTAAISNESGVPNIITNSIIYGNGPNFDQQFSTHQSAHQLNYNIIQGNYYGIENNDNNLLDVDPLFRDTSVNDYHLQSIACGYNANSPAIDAGDSNISDFLLDCATAGLGNRRSDMGAYGGADNWWDKSINPPCHYSGNVSGVWDCETIYIDGDILIPFGDTLIITNAVDHVGITGPYQIKVEGVLLAQGPQDATPTLNGEQLLFQGLGWHGIVFNNLNDSNPGTSIIENCRFDYANKLDAPYKNGGAIVIHNSDNVIVRKSVFYLNQARLGGAIYIENSDAQIDDCYFNLNGYEGGQNGDPSATGGGAMYIKDSNPYLHKLFFAENQSIGGGGAIVLDNSSPTITNIMMANNITEGLGGGMQLINGASPHIVNMTSVDNTAETAGGSFYLNPNSNPTITNSIMYRNTKPEIYLGGGTPTVTYSIIESAETDSYFGVGCLSVNPLLTAGSEYRLANNTCSYSDGSNAVSPAIDAGHPDSLDVMLDCDHGLGTVRADMGYYGGGVSTVHVGLKKIIVSKPIFIYPNPAKNYIIISSESNIYEVKVLDMTGKLVKQIENYENNSIDISNLNSGFYILKLKTDKGNRVGKFVKD